MSWYRVRIWLMLVIGLSAIWFLGFDRSQFKHWCWDCRNTEYTVQYRIFGVSVHQRKTRIESFSRQISSDLGAPCPHRAVGNAQLTRRWGMVYCASPCVNFLHGITPTPPPWYDADARDHMRNLGRAEPHLGVEFRNRVLFLHDMEYSAEFLEMVRTEVCDGIGTDEHESGADGQP